MTDRYICKAYTDEGRAAHWPTDFVFPPEEGDIIESSNGLAYFVSQRRHKMLTRFGGPDPVVVIELVKDRPNKTK